METIRSFCEWVVTGYGATALVAVWFIVMGGQIIAMRQREKGRITDMTLGRILLGVRCFAASVFSFGALILLGYGYLCDRQPYLIGAGIVGILSVLLWWSALRLGTAVPDRDCGPDG